jgi:hypothetical protein
MSEKKSNRKKRTPEERREWSRQWRHRNREKCLQYGRTYRKKHRERLVERQRIRGLRFPERLKATRKRRTAKNREYNRALYLQEKRAAIRSYGGKCACCGEAHECFLTIDHVNNDGAAHRRERATDGKQYGGSGFSMYKWLKKFNYPQDGRFQILCYDCNCAKQHDPVGHRAAHANAVNIDGLGDLSCVTALKKCAVSKPLKSEGRNGIGERTLFDNELP